MRKEEKNMRFTTHLLRIGFIVLLAFQVGPICNAQIAIPASGVINTIAGTGAYGYSGNG